MIGEPGLHSEIKYSHAMMSIKVAGTFHKSVLLLQFTFNLFRVLFFDDDKPVKWCHCLLELEREADIHGKQSNILFVVSKEIHHVYFSFYDCKYVYFYFLDNESEFVFRFKKCKYHN